MKVCVMWLDDVEYTVKELKKWMGVLSLPLIIPYSQKQFMKVVFSKDIRIFDHLILFGPKDYLSEHEDIRNMFENV